MKDIADAIERDMRMAMAEDIDRTIFTGDSGANEKLPPGQSAEFVCAMEDGRSTNGRTMGMRFGVHFRTSAAVCTVGRMAPSRGQRASHEGGLGANWSEDYPDRDRIVLVMDNLNTHKLSL